MEKQIGMYVVNEAYNYDNGYSDIEVFDNYHHYLGTLNGAKYDFDEVTEDGITNALDEGDYVDATDEMYEKTY